MHSGGEKKTTIKQQIENLAIVTDNQTGERLGSLFSRIQTKLTLFPPGFSGTLLFSIPEGKVMVIHDDWHKHVTHEVQATVVGGEVKAIFVFSEEYRCISRIEKSTPQMPNTGWFKTLQKLKALFQQRDNFTTYHDVNFAENRLMAIPIAISLLEGMDFEGLDLESPCFGVVFRVPIDGVERGFTFREGSNSETFEIKNDLEEQFIIPKHDNVQTIAQLVKECFELCQETVS